MVVPQALSETPKGSSGFGQSGLYFIIKRLGAVYATAKLAEGFCTRKRSVVDGYYRCGIYVVWTWLEQHFGFFKLTERTKRLEATTN